MDVSAECGTGLGVLAGCLIEHVVGSVPTRFFRQRWELEATCASADGHGRCSAAVWVAAGAGGTDPTDLDADGGRGMNWSLGPRGSGLGDMAEHRDRHEKSPLDCSMQARKRRGSGCFQRAGRSRVADR